MSSVTPVLDATRKEREKLQRKLDELVTIPAAEKRSLTDEEALQFEDFAARLQKKTGEIRSLEKQSAREDKAAAAAADGAQRSDETPAVEKKRSPAVVTSEPMTYNENPTGNSYFRDLGLVAAGGLDQSYRGAADTAAARIAQHEKEVRVEAERSPELARRLREIRATPAGLEQRVNPNTAPVESSCRPCGSSASTRRWSVRVGCSRTASRTSRCPLASTSSTSRRSRSVR